MFRSVVAATLPLIVGAFSIVGALFILYILTLFTSVSIYALNLVTMMGLGLSIDYSLFIVSRFREQLSKGESPKVAIKNTITSAGKTVVFSALTVGASLASLLVFPLPFLRSFAFGGIAVALVSLVGAVLLLPSMLFLLGNKINSLPVGKKISYEKGSKFWHKVAVIVMNQGDKKFTYNLCIGKNAAEVIILPHSIQTLVF